MEDTKEILDKLNRIEIDIRFIKSNMPDKDMFLTCKEEELLEESYANEKRGELLSGEELRKELKI